MNIQPADESVIPTIVSLWREMMELHLRIDPFFKISSEAPANFEKFVREQIASEDAQILVAIEDGSVLGYCNAQISKYPPVFERLDYGFITDLVVTVSQRRKGIGKQLLLETMNWFQTKGIDRIELRVSPGNEVGYSFWKKHGFKDYVHVLYKEK
jgi:ribosomal protein S18 acetylase RimI-like enzyme